MPKSVGEKEIRKALEAFEKDVSKIYAGVYRNIRAHADQKDFDEEQVKRDAKKAVNKEFNNLMKKLKLSIKIDESLDRLVETGELSHDLDQSDELVRSASALTQQLVGFIKKRDSCLDSIVESATKPHDKTHIKILKGLGKVLLASAVGIVATAATFSMSYYLILGVVASGMGAGGGVVASGMGAAAAFGALLYSSLFSLCVGPTSGVVAGNMLFNRDESKALQILQPKLEGLREIANLMTLTQRPREEKARDGLGDFKGFAIL